MYHTHGGKSGAVKDFTPSDPGLDVFAAGANNTYRRNTWHGSAGSYWAWNGSRLAWDAWSAIWPGAGTFDASSVPAEVLRACSAAYSSH